MLKSKVPERALRAPSVRIPRSAPGRPNPVVTDQLPITLPRAKADSRPESFADALRFGLRVVILDKGCLVNSIYNYPVNMVFFTTPELLEIGDIPFACSSPKPTRRD